VGVSDGSRGVRVAFGALVIEAVEEGVAVLEAVGVRVLVARGEGVRLSVAVLVLEAVRVALAAGVREGSCVAELVGA
jgi:hypothetical protein